MLKAVLDTNQIVSSVIVKHGPPAKLFEAWRRRQYLLITSRDIIQETKKVFYYPRIIGKYHLAQKDIDSVLDLLEREAVIACVFSQVNIIEEDPDDNKILACAAASEADYIVSGDQHLLSLKKYQNISIVKAKEFLEILDAPFI